MIDAPKRRLLIIDDEIDICNQYKDIFEKTEYEVEFALNGREALDRMNEKSFDVLLLDIMMPVMDGVQMLDEMKNHPPQFPQGPIVITTNLDPSRNANLQTLYKNYGNNPGNVGVVAEVVKASLDPDELVKRVDEILKHKDSTNLPS